MKTVSRAWGALNASKSRERRFYIKIETIPQDETGDVYIRSHDDISITTDGVILLAKPRSHPKIRTQNLNPDEGRSTIGTMSFDAIDISGSLTDEMRTALLSNDIGWRQKRVQYYSGFRQLSAADYELEDTQLIDRVTYSKGVYQFRCRDIQREMRKKIFEPKIARLAQPVSATDTTIEIFFNPGFEAVEHGASYSDAASGSHLYVKIDDEIIRVPAAGIGTTQLTSCVRGVLGTRAAAHTTDEEASVSRAKEVREVVYLELPVPKLVYALLTGNLIGQSGTLPDHWHLGIDAGAYVRLSEFQNIGSDLYVQSDDTLGMLEKHIIEEDEDGKTFIEKEILRKYGLFMPIHADGSIGLRRGEPVLSGSAVVGVLDDSMIVEDVTLTYAMDKILNEFRIGWNEIDGEPSRYLEIVDTDSVARWGASPRIEVVARGLVGSRQTDSRVRDIFEGLRDRYSGPPLTCEVTVFSSQSLYEVGDVVRVRTSRVRDFTNSATTILDRAFEIQGVSKNLSDGTVSYTLFGSSQKAGALPPLETTAALADGFYSATGTNIASLSGVVDAGSELVLPDGLTLTGATTVTGAVYYALKDVRIPAGDVVNYTQNVQLRIRGVLQIDGELNGAGAGIAGTSDTYTGAALNTAIGYFSAVNLPQNAPATAAGTPGYFGVTQADGALIDRWRGLDSNVLRNRVQIQSVPATITRGQVEAIPSLNIQVDDGAIVGIPSDLRGTSGGPGGYQYYSQSRGSNTYAIRNGGAGGAGGAGLLIISRGLVFGASGRIVSSGANGTAGSRNTDIFWPAWSSAGAGGAPGATLILLDGASSPSPVLTSGTIVADYGSSPDPSGAFNVMPTAWMYSAEGVYIGPDYPVPEERYTALRSASSGRAAGIAAARFFFLLPEVEPEDDVEDVVLANRQDISLSVTEAFSAVEDATLTVLVVDITEVDVTAAYSHANIYTRRTTGDDPDPAFVFRGGADPRLRVILPADGETYTIRAVPVLINGVEATQGVEETEIVSSPGLVRVAASVSYNRPNIWRRAPNGGAWSPADTTVDGTVAFVGPGGTVATRVMRATLNTTDGTITVASQSTSGAATSISTAGSGTGSVATTVTHDDSGVSAVLNFVSVVSGTDGANGSGVTILGTLAEEADLEDIVSPDPGDAYIIDGDLWVWDGSAWENVGQIQGPPGADGDDGLSVAELVIYRRASSAPSTPTGGSFDFGTQILTPPSSWSVGVPAGTDPVYVSRAVAFIAGQAGSFSSFTWSGPVLAFQDGANGVDGDDGQSVDIVFRRLAYQATAPSPSSGTPSGWYSDVNSVPAGPDPLWSMVGTRPDSASNFTWQTPAKIQTSEPQRRNITPGRLTLGSPSETPNGVWSRGSGTADLSSVIAADVGPYGGTPPMMRVRGPDTPATGTWYGMWRYDWPNDKARGYVAYVWARRRSADTLAASLYVGWLDRTPAAVQSISGLTDNTNPYFVSGLGDAAVPVGEWRLCVGVLQPMTDTVGLGINGLWNPATGQRITAASDLRHHATETVTQQRVRWGFWSNVTTHGAADGWDIIPVGTFVRDGTQPSIDDVFARMPGSLDSAILGTLTNQSHVVTAAADGTGYSLTGSGGTLRVWDGQTEVTGAGPAYSVVGTATVDGLTMAINATSGVYTLSGASWTGTAATFTLRARYMGINIDLVYSISKSRTGAAGAAGLNNAPVLIYRRAASSPTLPSATATYTFATGGITGLNNSWTATVPAANGQPLWVAHASASGTGATDTIASGEWSAPAIMAEDGAAGAAGGNTAVAYLYQRAASAPGAPANTLTYTFATGALSGTPGGGWSTTIPATDGNPLWVRTAVAFGTGATDSITAGEWSSSVRLVEDGADGADGLDAQHYAYNPSLEQGDVGWDAGGSITIASDSATARLGSWRAARTTTGNGARFNARRFPAQEGMRFGVTGWVRSTSGAGFTDIRWSIVWFNSSDTAIGSLNATYSGAATTTYQFVSAYGAAPAGTSYGRLAMRAFGQTSGTLYWDEGNVVNIDSVAMNILLGGTFTDFMEIASTGRIYSGKSTWDSAASGWIFEIDAGNPRFKIGSADGTKEFGYDGTDVFLRGGIISGQLISLSSRPVLAINAGGSATHHAQIRLTNAGLVRTIVGAAPGTATTVEQWLGGGINFSDYEARCTVISGALSGSAAANTWLSLGTDRTWGVAVALSTAAVEFDLEIRLASTGRVVASARFDCSIIVL